MDFKTYQQESKKTAIYPQEVRYLYPLLGMVGEVMETVDKATSSFHIQMDPQVVSHDTDLLLTEMSSLINRMIEMGKRIEQIKKHIRKNGLGEGVKIVSTLSDELRQELGKEVGDQMWYQAATCDSYNLQMEEIAFGNIQKLQSRQQRNVLEGNGDNR